MNPFLRWAGGKRKLAELIAGTIPSDFFTSDSFFREPFVGGGALMLYMGEPDRYQYVPGTRLHINDTNPDLVLTYMAIQNHLEALLKLLENLASDVSKEKYLAMRATVPNDEIERAARFIYLNKTGFNGLWRVNSKGDYNVPWGQLANPTIFDEEQLHLIAQRLQGCQITKSSYKEAIASSKSGDLIYFDPPYIPLSASSSFSKYAKDDFGLADQKELAGTIEELSANGVKVILSNSDTDYSREIFGKVLKLRQISASRAIAANAASRGSVKEILGTNFELPETSDLRKFAEI